MKKNNSLDYIHEFLNKEDDFSLVEHILDDIHDSQRFNNGNDKHIVYYLQLSDDEKSGEKKFWIKNIRHYSNLYVYAMLFNWLEQWPEDTTLKNKLDSFQTSFVNEIADEIKILNGENSEKTPSFILQKLKFITDAFLWKCAKLYPFQSATIWISVFRTIRCICQAKGLKTSPAYSAGLRDRLLPL